MNRIEKLFSEKKKNILSIYFTAGFPKLDSTYIILDSLQKYGVDMVEIGMPYSDPLADGPVIQHSSLVALQNGFTIEPLFKQLIACRNNLNLPLILMGYLNPVLQYGMENFCIDAQSAGIDGIILPDLPLSVYEKNISFFLKNIICILFSWLLRKPVKNESGKWMRSVKVLFMPFPLRQLPE